jgi:hypothetical protein
VRVCPEETEDVKRGLVAAEHAGANS